MRFSHRRHLVNVYPVYRHKLWQYLKEKKKKKWRRRKKFTRGLYFTPDVLSGGPPWSGLYGPVLWLISFINFLAARSWKEYSERTLSRTSPPPPLYFLFSLIPPSNLSFPLFFCVSGCPYPLPYRCDTDILPPRNVRTLYPLLLVQWYLITNMADIQREKKPGGMSFPRKYPTHVVVPPACLPAGDARQKESGH